MQSIDGALYFFNDDDVLFKIQLPNFLVPGPMVYSKNIDSIIIANSNLEVESYNFNSMKASTNNDLEQQKQIQSQENKKALIQPSWVANIGEQARQIRLHLNIYLQHHDIVVLGEQSLFILSEHGGKLRYQKRYQFSPSCFVAYHLPRRGADLYLEPK